MMFDTPTISHQPPTPPGSPNPPSPSSPPPLAAGGVVRAELAQQANEVCQLVAKANRAPNGLHADELRRLLSDIHSLHLLAQQLSSSSSSSTSSISTSTTSSSPSRGIAKKKQVHHASVLSRPLAALSSSSPSPASSSAWCATSLPPVPTGSSTTTTSAAAATAAARACHTPIRPRGHPLPTAATATTAATSGSSCLSPEIGAGPRACANCGTSSTVQWRCGADGKPSLCNACGLRYRYNLKKKALYEDIAVVRAMTQRSPPFAQHNHHNQRTHSPPSSLASASPSSASSPSASRSPSPPPPSVPSTAGCPPRPVPAPSTAAAATTSAPADASGEARRSNIYSLLN
ncbi:GATA zinc finger domain containing protein [Acanthamoeba castellanii str. Neff]|uniref:GATA zinc finger domain containing protein n=1 Tax=Acanthamoeba castellanii (strain ATCC 30010 / Neff) TaxID=1257118 RepID=L8HC44_ACACF|nr:GATA zinc finger domain containing protein [Acanthamoeba castellanii str. Neff]ELR22765.1 GATA zinc finger domain containing protein [Acanthamoeba castellanii str. Neff]